MEVKRFFSKLSLVALAHPLQSKKVILLLSLILIIGSFLRIYDLGAESLWLDEFISVNFSQESISSIIVHSGPARNNPPLYWVMLHYWIAWFGTSEVALRSLSAIFGIGSILLIYSVGKELFYKKVGLLASFITTISYFHIFYSQEARNYALLLFLSLLSYLFFIKILRQDRKFYYVVYFLTNLFLGYTHFYGALIILSQILFFIIFWSKYQQQRLKLTAILIAIIVSLLPLVFMIGPSTNKLQMIEGNSLMLIPALRDLFDNFAMYIGIGSGRYILYLLFLPLTLLSFLYVKKVGGKWTFKRPIESLQKMNFEVGFHSIHEVLLLLIWLSICVVIQVLISTLTIPDYRIRYSIGASPAFYLLIARGLSTIQIRRLLYPLLIAILFFSSFGLHYYYQTDVKPNWREAAKFVEMNSREGDVIIFSPSSTRRGFEYYYESNLPGFGTTTFINTREVATFIRSVAGDKDRVWFVCAYASNKGLAMNYLIETYGSSSLVYTDRLGWGVRLLLIDLYSSDHQ